MMIDDTPSDLHAKRLASLARVKRMAWWLDDAFKVPVIGRRVGLDGVIGLVPFVGDLVGAGLSTLLINEAIRAGAPKHVWLRMGANTGIDFLVGLVPIAGDLFDFAWKANRRNERVLRRWLEQETATGPTPPSTSSGTNPNWPGKLSLVLGIGSATILVAVLCRALWTS